MFDSIAGLYPPGTNNTAHTYPIVTTKIVPGWEPLYQIIKLKIYLSGMY